MTSFRTHTLRKPIAGGVHKEVWVKTELTVHEYLSIMHHIKYLLYSIQVIANSRPTAESAE